MPTTTVIEFVLQDEDTLAYEDVDLVGSDYQIWLSDPTNAFGVKRLDTSEVVIENAEPLLRMAQGRYEFQFTDPAPGLRYQYYVEWVHEGETTHLPFEISGGNGGVLASYLLLSDAEALAADELLGLAAWAAANASDRQKALKVATKDIDSAMRYQGRRYDLSNDQVLEFPRVPYEPGATSGQWPEAYYYAQPSGSHGVVWDWDEDSNVAVVPRDVKLATIYQADSILDGTRRKRLAAQHDGVASQGVGSVNTGYSGKPVQALCFEAYELMKKYQLRSGKMR